MQTIKNQRGMTLLSMTALAVVVAIVALVFIKLFPIYMENGQIHSVMTSLAEKHAEEEMSPREIREALSRRFSIEGIRGVAPSDVEIELGRDGLALYLDYEARASLFSNVELVVTFQERAGNTAE